MLDLKGKFKHQILLKYTDAQLSGTELVYIIESCSNLV